MDEQRIAVQWFIWFAVGVRLHLAAVAPDKDHNVAVAMSSECTAHLGKQMAPKWQPVCGIMADNRYPAGNNSTDVYVR